MTTGHAMLERELTTDVLICGGGVGGVAAALAALRHGTACVILEPTDWLGGQLTTQGVPPDENRWVESFGCSASYRELREGVRCWYRANRPLRAAAAADPHLNPGGGWVSRLCAEPRVWRAVIDSLLAPYIASKRLIVLCEHALGSVERDAAGVRVRSVTAIDAVGRPVHISAKLVLDATELGDVLELAGVEHAIGAEAHSTHGELHAPAAADPRDQQACSWCFALEHRLGEDHTIDRPPDYDFWRTYTPVMAPGQPAWTGPLFSWTVPSHNAEGRRTFRLVPWPEEPDPGEWEMWRYRRIVDHALLSPSSDDHPDVALINMVQMDYWQRPLLGVSAAERAAALAGARAQSTALLYWMQTEAPRHDSAVRTGYPGLRLRCDELGTRDGFAKQVYIREPRRLVARAIVTERHIGTEQRQRDGVAAAMKNWDATPFGVGEPFADSVGIGHYPIDLHPSCSGRNSVYVPAAPFRIPLGALIPVRVENVLAAGKCLGVTHVTNSCYRMHQVEWSVGEAAGVLAAVCARDGVPPAAVHASPGRTRELQRVLGVYGVPLAWPWEG